MGMYDEIYVDVPLPLLPDAPKYAFQTKSLELWLDTYRIRKDGTVVKERSSGESQNKEVPECLPHSFRLNFYTDTEDGSWREYEADVHRGRVTRIRLWYQDAPCVALHETLPETEICLECCENPHDNVDRPGEWYDWEWIIDRIEEAPDAI